MCLYLTETLYYMSVADALVQELLGMGALVCVLCLIQRLGIHLNAWSANRLSISKFPLNMCINVDIYCVQGKFVAEAMSVIAANTNVPVSVKCRIGVDDHDSYNELCTVLLWTFYLFKLKTGKLWFYEWDSFPSSKNVSKNSIVDS